MTYTQEDFVRVVLAEFPELHSEFAECDGMLHLQMGCFARLMQAAKGESDWPTYKRGVLAAQHLWQRPDDALLNALNVSFLENLDFSGPGGPIAWRLLTPELQRGWQAMQDYLTELARAGHRRDV